METVVLEGKAEDIGRVLGGVWASDLVRDTDDFFARMGQEGLEADFLVREAREYERRLRDLAPHMFAELTATAGAAGVPAERFVAYMGLKYCFPERVYGVDEWIEPREGCTSFMAAGRASGIAANLLHKNRDARQVPQAVHVRHVEGKQRVLGAGDVGDLGLCHALNAEGLAGKTNSGNRVEKPLRHSISTTEVLRHVVEECTTCEQALDRLQHLARAGLITNGTGGCIWLFADRERGLIVEEVPFKIAWTFVEDDVEARQNDFRLDGMRADRPDTPRYATAMRKMRGLAGRVRAEDLNRLSRSMANHPKSICHDATNSATTSVVPFDRAIPPRWEMACGHPNNTFYLPMSPVMKGIPRPLVDGSLWRLAHRLHKGNRRGPHPDLDSGAFEGRFRERHAVARDPEEMGAALAENVRDAEGALRRADSGSTAC